MILRTLRTMLFLGAGALAMSACHRPPSRREAAVEYLRKTCGIKRPTENQIHALEEKINISPRPFSGIQGFDLKGKCPEIIKTREVVKEVKVEVPAKCPEAPPEIRLDPEVVRPDPMRPPRNGMRPDPMPPDAMPPEMRPNMGVIPI